MICVILRRDAEGVLTECSVKGHAGFAPNGKDIVCAAVTTLVKTSFASLNDSACSVSPVTFTAFGDGEFGFSIKQNAASKARLIYAGDFLQKGFELLQKEFPQYLELRIKITNKPAEA